VAGFCGHDNGRSDFIKGMKFLDKLSDYQLLKKGSTPWTETVRTIHLSYLALCHTEQTVVAI
jgi:hypothetical protein